MNAVRRSLMNAKGSKELPNYLCFTALEDGTFTLTIGENLSTSNFTYIEYSIDNGNTWVKTDNIASTEVTVTTPTITEGNSVLWRGKGVKNNSTQNDTKTNFGNFSSSCEFNVSGNICSYLFLDDFEDKSIKSCTFEGLFEDCVNLIDASELILPNTTSTACLAYSFKNCIKLTNTPAFSEINLSASCYYEMFRGCTSLVEAPNLPAKTLAQSCYSGMFRECTNLKYPPSKLSALSLPAGAYTNMFHSCNNLLYCPEIYATEATGGDACSNMFRKCSSLTSAPILYLTTLARTTCYMMFNECTSLTTIPSLPALTLTNSCYSNMLVKTKVNYIKMLATDVSASSCMTNWLANVPNVSTSIFVKHIDATWTTTGNSGVPTNWTIIYYDPAVDKYYTDQTKTTECDDHGNPI